MMRVRLLMMLSLKGLSHKNRRQHRKDEGLQESHQHFDQVNKDGETDRQRGSSPAGSRIQLTKNEDE